MIVKVNGKSNQKVQEILSQFPYFTIQCNLSEVLKERGLSLQELSDLTGLRVASISELCNMKRSTINIPHVLVIAKVLRITDISKLFEFIMPANTAEQFKQDQEIIERQALLPEQDEVLSAIRKEKEKLKEERKATRKAERLKKKALAKKLKEEQKAKEEAERKAKEEEEEKANEDLTEKNPPTE